MSDDTTVDLVTGAFSYSGSHIARRLLESGRRVRTLTFHPDRPHQLRGTSRTSRGSASTPPSTHPTPCSMPLAPRRRPSGS